MSLLNFRKVYKFIGILIVLGTQFNHFVYSQDASIKSSNPYYISKVYNFKKSILSLSFDDGIKNQFSIGLPILDNLKIPATFYVVGWQLGDSLFRSTLLKAIKQGHEIGSHTVSHPNLILLSNEEVSQELSLSKNLIDSLVGKNYCLSFAYPGGIYNNSVVNQTKKMYLAARTTKPGFNNLDNLKKYELKSMGYMSRTNLKVLKNHIKYSVNNGLWLIECLHGIENEGYQPMSKVNFVEHINFIKTLENDVWLTPISNVIKYCEERKTAQIEYLDINDNFYKIRIEDNLDDSVYNQPLSFLMKIPVQWENVKFFGGNYRDEIYENGNKFIRFNALPNNKEIMVFNGSKFNYKSEADSNLFFFINPNPFNDYITLFINVMKSININVSIFNLSGKLYFFQSYFCNFGQNSFNLRTSNIPEGVYILSIVGDGLAGIRKKIIKLGE